MLSKKKVVIVSVIFIAIVFFITLITLVTLSNSININENNKESEQNVPTDKDTTGNNNIVSYNISSTKPNLHLDNELKFSLEKIDMGVGTDSTEITSKLSTEVSIKVQSGLARIRGNDGTFLIAIFSSHGTSGGFYENVNREDLINSKSIGALYRVNSSKENLENNVIDVSLNNYYFYSSDFQTKDECSIIEPESDGCGSLDITIGNEFDKSSIQIYCATESKEKVLYCDEFVKNLEIR